MQNEVGEHQKKNTDEEQKGNKGPLWKRFPRHMSNKGSHGDLLKLGKGKLPGDRGDEAKEQGGGQVAEEEVDVCQHCPGHRELLKERKKDTQSKCFFVTQLACILKNVNWMSMWTR